MQRVLVLGAGGIGGLIAAKLAGDPDLAVSLAVRRHTTRLTLTVDGRVEEAPVTLVEDPAQLDPVDWVVVATKSYDTDSLGPWLSSSAVSQACVAVAQNGVEHVERLAPYVAPERVMPVIVTYGAERHEPGAIVQTLTGTIRVPRTPLGTRFASLSRQSDLALDEVDDFESAVWTKLAWNLVGNSLTTILDLPVRELGRQAEARAIGDRLVAECRAVARTRGAHLPEELEDEIFATFAGYPLTVRSSMWQDRDAGRRLEYDALSGALVRIGSAAGIDVPYSRMTTSLLTVVSSIAVAPPRTDHVPKTSGEADGRANEGAAVPT